MKWLVLLVLIMLIPAASADASDVGAGMIKDGIYAFLKGIANDIYSTGNVISNQTNTSDNTSFAALLNDMVWTAPQKVDR